MISNRYQTSLKTLVVLALIFLLVRPEEDFSPDWLQYSDEEKQAFQADSYNYFISEKGNKIWAAALGLAWLEFRSSFASNEPIRMNTTNKLQETLIKNYNNANFSVADLDPSSYYVTSGFGKQTVQRINRQVKAKFPTKTFQDINSQGIDDKDIISYSYIFKQFDYKTPFETDSLFRFDGEKSTGFYADSREQKSQLYYKYYNGRSDFMVGIETTTSDEVILVKMSDNSKMRFQKLVDLISISDNIPSKRLASVDKFQMPRLTFDFKRELFDLKGVNFENQDLKQYQLKSITEGIKLEVSESGVRMENEGIMIGSRMFNFSAKQFILDSQFWLVLREKGKRPYLVVNVHNPTDSWSNV